MKQAILFVEGKQGFVNQAICTNLQAAGFNVIRIPDEPDAIAGHRYDADMLLYYPFGKNGHIRLITSFLTELCKDEHKTLCLIGDEEDLAEAQRAENSDMISAIYPRPLDVNRFVEEMLALSGFQEEYNRTKSILLIDDDNDFLSIVSHWLKGMYKVDGVRSGAEALCYLNQKHPDLVLLDYEMPEMDGYEVMRMMRKNPHIQFVPIIFLTGRNDRESVMKIIHHRPDGYLLKPMTKEELLDSLSRFFSDSLTRKIFQDL